MSFLLCCLTSNKNVIDNNIEKNTNDKSKQSNKLNIIAQQVEGIQTTVLNEENSSKKNNNIVNPRRNSKNQDTLIDIDEFEKCQYWFYEVIKNSVINHEGYGKNKKELHDHMFKFIDLNKTLKYYNKYNKKYNNFDKYNIKIFCEDSSNLEFIQDIRISENIYRFH
jgi:hypothetical protein